MNPITPARRVGQIEEYYLQRKMKQVAALNARGCDIVSLGVGGPDLMPPAAAIDTLCEAARRPDVHSYSVTTGIPALRRAYADFYSRFYGVTLDPDTQILPLIGSKEAIMHISMTFLNPGDAVLVPDPGYPTYTSVSRLVGARVVKYPLTEDGGWLPDFDAMESLPLDGVRLMWLNYPHMPTCTQPSDDVFERAVDFARRHNIVIVNDNPSSFILRWQSGQVFHACFPASSPPICMYSEGNTSITSSRISSSILNVTSLPMQRSAWVSGFPPHPTSG